MTKLWQRSAGAIAGGIALAFIDPAGAPGIAFLVIVVIALLYEVHLQDQQDSEAEPPNDDRCL